MFKIIKKIIHFEIIIFFIVLSLINFKDFFLSCTNYIDLSFNSQIPLTWDFTVLNKMLPYKDIYIPYGVLFYFKNVNEFISIIYFFLPTILFIMIYTTIKSAFKNKSIAILAFISFCLFVWRYAGIENFVRYGIIMSTALLFSRIFHTSRLISIKASFLLGILIGGIFSLVNDQGIYAYILFIFLLAIIPPIKGLKKINYFKYFLSRMVINGLGIALSILPFFIFLNTNNMTNEFLLFIKHLPDFALYAKTPFIPYSTTIDNLFTFTSLFIAIVALSYKIFFSKEKLSLISILEISLVIVLCMLEQKSIIRSIDKQITFISFFLYIVLFYEFVKGKVKYIFVILSFAVITVLILLGFGIHPFINYKLDFKRELIYPLFHENLNVFLLNKSKLCLNSNLNKLIIDKNTNFEKVKEIINNDSGRNPKIFDYLSDPVFYVIFNQKPPYYFTIFEATPVYAQKSDIKYIEQNKVNYVIYNNDILSIQDGVPSNVRSKVLYEYIMNNFKVLEIVDNFIIYKKK